MSEYEEVVKRGLTNDKERSLFFDDIIKNGNTTTLEALKKMIENQTATSKSFGAMSLKDLSKVGGLNLNIKNILTEEIRLKPSLILPSNIEKSVPTEHLLRHLARLSRVWSKNSETGRRAFIDALLAEAVDIAFHGRVVDEKMSDDEDGDGDDQNVDDVEEEEDDDEEGKGPLRVFTDVDLKWQGSTMAVSGTVDYLLGHIETDDAEEEIKDSYFIVVEAKKEWPEDAFVQAIAAGGALLRRRQASAKTGKNGGVFVVLTNATMWNFYYIDKEGVVYCSGDPITAAHTGLILTWLTFFLKGTAAISPRASMVSMKEEEKASILNGINDCCKKLWVKKKKKSSSRLHP
ncbi:hypothetical protein HK097_007553 [Rhizophlyctis rosea]|uniref:Uncharacterized protein n=1 Tax=Rhizophlyctis rosea TaxID=64517 RepID=A0AAD5SBF8_9FUNG|nr:hypothetical protein HK097_007553 [Rhizophlyctis rosea]